MEIDKYRSGMNIRKALDKHQVKQKTLAKALRGNEVMVSKWINGETLPSTQSLLKIAYLLNMSIDELMEGVLIP